MALGQRPACDGGVLSVAMAAAVLRLGPEALLPVGVGGESGKKKAWWPGPQGQLGLSPFPLPGGEGTRRQSKN